MYKLIQKNQKKLLAVFGVLLMIVFIIPPAAKYGSGARNPVIGYIGGEPVYDTELRQAKDEWQLLRQIPVRMQGQTLPLSYYMLASTPSVFLEIDKNPELFLLLQKDALRRGIRVGDDMARSVLKQVDRDIDVSSSSARVQEAVEAVRSILLVSSNIENFAEALKISQPVWRHQLASDYQQVRLNLVEFRADDYLKNVPAPTSVQLQEQFDKYRNDPPREIGEPPTSQNPLGLGYKVPTRVKLQYLEVPHDQVLNAIKGTGDKLYEWRVKAAAYYAQHQEEFRNPPPPATKPANTQPAATQATTQAASVPTQPATEEATASAPAPTTQLASSQPTTTQAAASQPAIKPLNEVQDQIIAKLAEPEVARLMETIQKEIEDRLTADYEQIRQNDPRAIEPSTAQSAATQPATTQAMTDQLAATRPSNPLMSLEPFEQLRGQIQQKHQVDLQLHDIAGDWQTAKELGKLPGISAAFIQSGQSFVSYATSFVRSGASATNSLHVWEGSQPLEDSRQNVYLFRLTAAEPAHAPADVSAVAKQVGEDWRLARAYEQARQAADNLLNTARTLGLAQAARADALTIQTATAGPFTTSFFGSGDTVSGYTLTDSAARHDFVASAKQLLASASPADPHPAATANLPTERKALVMELAGVKLFIPEESTFREQIVHQDRMHRLSKLADTWFSYNAVVSRLNYKEQKS